MPRTRPADVLSYWFEGPSDRTAVWSDVDLRTAEELHRRFGDAVQAALRGRLRTWRWSPEGRVALVLLLDVFPRHLWVGQRRSLAGDRRAQAVALSTLASSRASRLPPELRALLYLPLMHAEDEGMQDRAVDGFERLVAEHGDRFRPFLERALERRAMVQRFGRFPHRNPILGRSSTPVEAAWLRTDAPPWAVARLPRRPKAP